MEDAAVIEAQLGRPPRGLARVAARCPHGRPAVAEQESYLAGGEPFPTTYYLTCPWLVAGIARVEAGGGVERFSREATLDPTLRASLEEADAEQRRLRPELDVGIGGTRSPGKLKCLHAHAAFALARPGYELGERIVQEAGEPWCPDARCKQASAGSEDA